MALVNPQIAMSYRPTTEYQPRNALAEYAQVQQIVGSQMQQDVARAQLQKMQRTDDAMERIRQASIKNGGPGDMKEIATAFLGSPDFQHQQLGITMLQRLQGKGELADLNKTLGFGAAPAAAPTVAPAAAPPVDELVAAPIIPPKGTVREFAPGGAAGPEMPLARGAPAPVNALAPAAVAPTNALAATTAPAAAPSGRTMQQLQEAYLKASSLAKLGVEGAQGTVDLLKQEMDDMRKAYEVKGRLVTTGGKVLYEAPAEPTNIAVLEREIATLTQQGVPANDPRIVARQSAIAQAAGQTDPLIKQYEFAQRQGFKGSMFDYKRQLAQAGRSITPPPPAAPVAVIDPASGNTVYVSREEALSKRMTPAGQGVNLTPKQIQTLEVKYPQATAAVKTFESNADRLAKDLETLANHPGLSGISGLIYGRTPALTAEARQAQALYDSIVARGGFKELQDMRAASPTGGALGNVSNQENQYLRDAFAPINRTQDTADLKQALLGAAQATVESRQRVRDAYDQTYEYRSQRGGAGAPSGAGGATGNWSVVR